LIDILLREEIGGCRPPDLTAPILARAFVRRRPIIGLWLLLLTAAGILLALCGVWLLQLSWLAIQVEKIWAFCLSLFLRQRHWFASF